MKATIFKRWRWFLALGGLFLLWRIAENIGYAAIIEVLHTFGWRRIAGLTALYGIFQLCFCLAWRVLIVEPVERGFFGHLVMAYLAGDALNMTVPSANLAGEPVKVMLLSDRMDSSHLVASVAVYKMADFFSMTLFLVCGLLLHELFFSLPRFWFWGGAVVAGGMSIGCVFLFLLQKNGFFAPLIRFLNRFSRTAALAEKLTLLNQSDENIRQFLRIHARRFFVAVFFHFLAWVGGAVEIYIFLRLIRHPAPFVAAIVIETFSLFINNIAFMVPGRLGVLESGRVALFSAMHLGSAAGLAYSLVRRLREMVWIAAGFILLGIRGQEKNS